MKVLTMDRRTVLRGIGGVTIPLPFLGIMMPSRIARAEAPISKTGIGGAPKRFIVLFTGSGQAQEFFKNTGGSGGAPLTLSPWLAPLERHKEKLIFIDGICNRTAYDDPGGGAFDQGHERPMTCGTSTATFSKNKAGGGISIDQEIANNVGTSTKFKSLELGVQPRGGNSSAFAYSGAGIALPYAKPQDVFKRVFTGFQADPAVLQRLRAKKQSILDGVKRDYDAFVPKLGGDDRTKVQAHLESIRAIEKRINDKPIVASTVCSAPAAPANATDVMAVGKQQLDLLVMAMACDLTRVASVIFVGAGADYTLPGMSTSLHAASHGNEPQRNIATQWHANYFAEFFDKLKAVQEPTGGTLFDNSLVLWTSEHGAIAHNFFQNPILLAGGAGGYLKSGGTRVYYTWKQTGFDSWTGCRNNSDLYVSLLNAMGVPATTFGEPRYCTGPLNEIVA